MRSRTGIQDWCICSSPDEEAVASAMLRISIEQVPPEKFHILSCLRSDPGRLNLLVSKHPFLACEFCPSDSQGGRKSSWSGLRGWGNWT